MFSSDEVKIVDLIRERCRANAEYKQAAKDVEEATTRLYQLNQKKDELETKLQQLSSQIMFAVRDYGDSLVF